MRPSDCARSSVDPRRRIERLPRQVGVVHPVVRRRRAVVPQALRRHEVLGATLVVGALARNQLLRRRHRAVDVAEALERLVAVRKVGDAEREARLEAAVDLPRLVERQSVPICAVVFVSRAMRCPSESSTVCVPWPATQPHRGSRSRTRRTQSRRWSGSVRTTSSYADSAGPAAPRGSGRRRSDVAEHGARDHPLVAERRRAAATIASVGGELRARRCRAGAAAPHVRLAPPFARRSPSRRVPREVASAASRRATAAARSREPGAALTLARSSDSWLDAHAGVRRAHLVAHGAVRRRWRRPRPGRTSPRHEDRGGVRRPQMRAVGGATGRRARHKIAHRRLVRAAAVVCHQRRDDESNADRAPA